MILLVSGASKIVSKYAGHPNLGQLLDPRSANRYRDDMPTAADNSAFSNFKEKVFLNMCDKLIGKKLLWVSAPDVVGDARATMRQYYRWLKEIKEQRGLPIAYVLQDGTDEIGVPHEDDYDAVFIGGTTSYKYSLNARYQVHSAKEKGKLVHMGRVNSFQRVAYARSIGCDSFDGSGFSRFSEQKIPKYLKYLSQYQSHIDFVEKYDLSQNITNFRESCKGNELESIVGVNKRRK